MVKNSSPPSLVQSSILRPSSSESNVPKARGSNYIHKDNTQLKVHVTVSASKESERASQKE